MILSDTILVANNIAYSSTAPIIVPVIMCQFCRFWKAESDGMAGECTSALMADMVWAKWDTGSPIMTAWNFEETRFFEGVE